MSCHQSWRIVERWTESGGKSPGQVPADGLPVCLLGRQLPDLAGKQGNPRDYALPAPQFLFCAIWKIQLPS